MTDPNGYQMIPSNFSYTAWLALFIFSRWQTNKSFIDWIVTIGMLHGVSLICPSEDESYDDIQTLYWLALSHAHQPGLPR